MSEGHMLETMLDKGDTVGNSGYNVTPPSVFGLTSFNSKSLMTL